MTSSLQIAQGSPEWFAVRCGKITASRIADLMAKTRSGWGASRYNYMAQLIAEKLTGTVEPSFSNAAMKWGTETEPDARNTYAFLTDSEVVEVGFVVHPTIPDAGASPDGLVGDDGLVEIKCPNTATHIEYFLGKIPDKYIKQMQFQMACTGRKWCDFVSYDPRMPPEYQIKIRRVNRDDKLIVEINEAIKGFIMEMALKIQELKEAA
jgi:putative phage-type endonuclease